MKLLKKGWLVRVLNRPIVKGVLKGFPIIGDVVDNLTESTFDAPEGVLDKNKLMYQVLRLAILCVLLYLVFSGKMSMDEATEAKEFLN